jgi:hypothetical protein
MDRQSFDITLPSNASIDTHPDNKINSYITQLPSEIRLTGEWEVGLREIHYPRTWPLVVDDEAYISVTTVSGAGGVLATAVGVIPPGEYLVMPFVAQLKKSLKELTGRVTISHHVNAGKIGFTVNKGVELGLSPAVSAITGFGYKKTILQDGTTRSPHAMDFTGGIDAVYVYSDLIQEKIVGHRSVPLLRVVPAEGKYGNNVYREYIKPLYIPISHNTFRTVEVNILDSAGRKIPFQSGKLTIVLHLRKIS